MMAAEKRRGWCTEGMITPMHLSREVLPAKRCDSCGPSPLDQLWITLISLALAVLYMLAFSAAVML